MARIFIICFLMLSLTGYSQFGDGIQFNSELSFGGYTMFENFDRTYLIDNCGQVVNSWSVTNSQLHTKLTEDGNLMYIQQGVLFLRDWDDNIITTLAPGDGDILLVYEVIELPNKNFLCLARELFSDQDFEDIGYQFDPGESANRIDSVVELDRETGQVVWRWNLSDHVIQQRDPSLPNYGIVKDNPQLLDMDAVRTVDWTFTESFMINGMDYNAELDQIVLSIRKLNEIAIIDHSTTTEEAAGSTGGKYGQGGDILYRWGNPLNYGQGSEDDHRLFFQHNPNWVQYGEHAGKIILFNNGLARPGGNYSEGLIVETPVDSDGFYSRVDGEPFGPEEPSENYSEFSTNVGDLFSDYTSGAKVLPNGNIFITEGDEAILREFTPEGLLVWEYGVTNSFYIFRGVRYGSDYPGLAGRELIPNGTAESPPSTYDCNIFSSVEEVLTTTNIEVLQHGNSVIIKNPDRLSAKYGIYDLSGRQVLRNQLDSEYTEISIQTLLSGLYTIQITDLDTGQLLESARLNCLKN